MSRNMRYANNYKGLKKRPEYDDIVDYLNNKLPKIEYPNRLASFLRRTNQLSNLLDSDGYSLFDLEMQQQKNMVTEQQKMAALLKMGTPPPSHASPSLHGSSPSHVSLSSHGSSRSTPPPSMRSFYGYPSSMPDIEVGDSLLVDAIDSASVDEQAQIAGKQFLGQIYEQHGSRMAHGLASVAAADVAPYIAPSYVDPGNLPPVPASPESSPGGAAAAADLYNDSANLPAVPISPESSPGGVNLPPVPSDSDLSPETGGARGSAGRPRKYAKGAVIYPPSKTIKYGPLCKIFKDNKDVIDPIKFNIHSALVLTYIEAKGRESTRNDILKKMRENYQEVFL